MAMYGNHKEAPKEAVKGYAEDVSKGEKELGRKPNKTRWDDSEGGSGQTTSRESTLKAGDSHGAEEELWFG